MTDISPYSIRAFVSGRVQGVCYRAFSRDQALAAGICGWAINLADGRVEVRLQGREQDVNKVLEKLRVGPPMAEVTHIAIEPAEPQALRGFTTG